MATPWQLVDLAEQPQWVDTLLDWQHAEWLRHNPHASLDPSREQGALRERRALLLAHLRPQAIPSSYIALRDLRPQGVVSLIRYAKSADPQRVWLSNLYVIPAARFQGLGQRLLHHAEQAALRQGIAELWLSALQADGFYRRHAWQISHFAELAGREYCVMRKTLTG